MKLLGIAMLFLLCVAGGFGAAARIERRAQTLQAVYKDVGILLVTIRARRLPLWKAARVLPEGTVRARITGEKPRRTDALTDAESERLDAFLNLLAKAGSEEIASMGESYRSELAVSIAEAEKRRGETKLFRSVGALCGAILAVLLW